MKKFCLIVCALLCLLSCNKESVSQKPVLLRIENKTPQHFAQVITSGEIFDSIDAFSKSSYRSVPKILSAPSAVLITATDTAYAGIFFIDYPSYIEEGKYTLQIVEDSLAYYGYNCTYIKD